MATKLQLIQNKCLRVVAGAYRATPTRSLEIETFTPPLDLYLDGRLVAFQRRLAIQKWANLLSRPAHKSRIGSGTREGAGLT
jgi:hypothetical protein